MICISALFSFSNFRTRLIRRVSQLMGINSSLSIRRFIICGTYDKYFCSIDRLWIRQRKFESYFLMDATDYGVHYLHWLNIAKIVFYYIFVYANCEVKNCKNYKIFCTKVSKIYTDSTLSQYRKRQAKDKLDLLLTVI